MQKIDRLTPEQEASIPAHVEEWRAIGLSTDPIDEKAAIEAINLLYECGGLPPPKEYKFFDGPLEGLKEAKKYGANVSSASYGSQDASWLSFYDFFYKHFGLAEKARGLVAVAKTCGWIWTFDELAIITRRPVKIKFDDRNLLHCENGPAIEYADGLKVYAWHGQRIPGEWIEVGVDAKTAIAWPQVEQRRAACEILGWVNIIKELGGVTIDEDPDPEIGTLVEVDIPEIGKARFIRVQCGTKREFALPVPPELKTALGAQAWMVGLDEEDFDKPDFRT